MALLICIDTSQKTASVCLAENENILGLRENESQKDHAAWLHMAIKDILDGTTYTLEDVDAFVVSNGPGSYTGLRIGLAAAKGFCYALNKPLITINTLLQLSSGVVDKATDLICAVIDARRQEVYTAIYNKELENVMAPTPHILSEDSFANFYQDRKMIFVGDGIKKVATLIFHPNISFSTYQCNCICLVSLGLQAFHQKEFADLAYVEPFYLKNFYSVGTS